MKVYFGISQESRQFVFDLLKVSTWTAKNIAKLIPIIMYDGDFEDQKLDWFKRNNIKIINTQVSFIDTVLNGNLHIGTAKGAFLRTMIPVLEQDDNFVLYCDCDTMFLCELKNDNFKKPKYASCCGEFERNNTDYMLINTGVMVMNVPNLKEDKFFDFIKENYNSLHTYDQTAYIEFYKDKIEHLDDEFNWKHYWGINPNAKIIHFHGPKPSLNLDVIESIDVYKNLMNRNLAGFNYYRNKFIEIFNEIS